MSLQSKTIENVQITEFFLDLIRRKQEILRIASDLGQLINSLDNDAKILLERRDEFVRKFGLDVLMTCLLDDAVTSEFNIASKDPKNYSTMINFFHKHCGTHSESNVSDQHDGDTQPSQSLFIVQNSNPHFLLGIPITSIGKVSYRWTPLKQASDSRAVESPSDLLFNLNPRKKKMIVANLKAIASEQQKSPQFKAQAPVDPPLQQSKKQSSQQSKKQISQQPKKQSSQQSKNQSSQQSKNQSSQQSKQLDPQQSRDIERFLKEEKSLCSEEFVDLTADDKATDPPSFFEGQPAASEPSPAGMPLNQQPEKLDAHVADMKSDNAQGSKDPREFKSPDLHEFTPSTTSAKAAQMDDNPPIPQDLWKILPGESFQEFTERIRCAGFSRPPSSLMQEDDPSSPSKRRKLSNSLLSVAHQGGTSSWQDLVRQESLKLQSPAAQFEQQTNHVASDSASKKRRNAGADIRRILHKK